MDLNSILERKDAIIDDEKKKNDEMSITIASLEKKLTKAEEEDTKKAEEFVKKTALLINESEKYEKQIDELKSLLEDANNTINEYHQTIVSSKDGKDALSAANKVLESQVSDLKTKIHELEEEIITFKTDKNESGPRLISSGIPSNTICLIYSIRELAPSSVSQIPIFSKLYKKYSSKSSISSGQNGVICRNFSCALFD